MSRSRTGIAVLLCWAPALAAGGCGGGAPAPGAAVIAASSSIGAAAANPVTVSPLPGTPDASPATQISFLGGRGTSVWHVRVRGSSSGVHAGRLRRYSTGTGESFLPTRPFVPGERVTVSARASSGGRTRAARTTFTVAHEAPVSAKEFPPAAGDASAVQHYSSAPELTPSKLTITTPAQAGAAPGLLFLAPYQGAGSPGPMIADQSGNLVWFHRLPAEQQASNLGVQSFHGAPALVWWQGRILQLGFGEGEAVIYDGSYRQVGVVRAGNGYRADLHTIKLTPQGTAWIDAYDPVRMDLSALGGAAGGVLSDCVVQEVDLATGLVMWEWHALGHVPLADSKNPVPHSSYPWDYVHLNSADPGPAGDVLLSMRNTWSLDDVDIHSGGFRWMLGGPHSTFALGRAATFYWQHDGAFQPGGLISLFDNGSDPPKEKQSRGLLLAPDRSARRAVVAGHFANPTRTLLASSQGTMRRLAGGDWLLGYGGLPNFTEFDSSGRVLLDGTLGRGVQSFATNLSPWQGRPLAPPSLVALGRSGAGTRVAVSWNGDTRTASWRALAGPSPAALAPLASTPRSGFETTISLPASHGYAAVQALDAAGRVIGASPAIAL